MELNRIFLFGLLIVVIAGCNKDFEKVSSPTYFFKYSYLRDSVSTEPIIDFNINSTDSLLGSYNFSVLPGFEGFSLRLRGDSSFEEKRWSDYRSNYKTVRGKWKVNDSCVVLSSLFQSLQLRIHQYKWATFLIPLGKEQTFSYHFNRSIQIIDSLDNVYPYVTTREAHRHLGRLRTSCFIRKINR